ncbi:MAG: hypothetical protein RL012_2 [Bacteroidota bacterium]|jgi:hypothetical protein
MMEHKSHKDASQKLALVISFFCHTLLLLGAYYLPIRQLAGSSSGYSIVLNTAARSRQEKVSEEMPPPPPPSYPLADEQPSVENKKAEKRIRPETNKAKIPKDAAPDPQNNLDEDTTTEQIESPAQDPSEASAAVGHEAEAKKAIDERSLYKIYQGKQTGALLELAGWMWDTAPQPQDNTEESGKIVFQITIDEFGEVIAIRTLEKTISPLVEKIYKEALTSLTFSKTSDNLVYTPTSTGKVTFILQVK